MLNDVSHALRVLVRRPGSPVVAITCLALGVGTSTALFGVIDALLFRPPAGVADAGRLTRVRRALAISAPGILAGGLSAFVVSRFFASRLVGVSTSAPTLYVTVACALAALTMLASYCPGGAPRVWIRPPRCARSNCTPGGL
jgi:hypothetical protein